MALKDLVKKSKEPKTVKVSGELVKYVEFNPKQDAEATRVAKARFIELNPVIKEDTKEHREAAESVFVSSYKVYMQVKEAGDDISEFEFFQLSESYIQELIMAIHFQTRKEHPEYFELQEELTKQSQKPYQELLKQLATLQNKAA